MKFVEHLKQRSPYERTFHAVSFEIIGVLTSTPIISLITNKPVGESSALALVVSLIATLWNYIYNLIFDKLRKRYQFQKTLFVRVSHGIIFELGLIIITTPIVAFLFRMSIKDAFLLELGMLLYFLPYSIVYNWIYDKVRAKLIHKYDK